MMNRIKKPVLTLLGSIAILAFVVSCGSDGGNRRDATSVGKNGWVFEGFSCAPDTTKALQGLSPAQYCQDVPEDEQDYLYIKMTARASQNAVRRKSIAMSQSTCRQAALDQVKGDGLSKIIGDYVERVSGVADGESTGSAIITETKGKIKGIGIYDCCSLNLDTGLCAEDGEPETWTECQCVGYMKFPGGRDAFETMAEESDGL